MMKSYQGIRNDDGTCHVSVVQVFGTVPLVAEPLNLRLDLVNHSPTGFEWGYAGSGPSQLALAILADVLGDDKAAITLHQHFKFHTIAKLPRDTPWELTVHQVLESLVYIALEGQPEMKGSA
jgi:hypothetical protein